MKILVTGGTGFIGNHLINSIIENNHNDNIINVDLFNNVTHDHCNFKNVDIRKPIIYDIDYRDTDIIFHLAALCKEPGYQWEEYFQTNYIGTKNVCEFAIQNNIRNIVFTSTMMVFKAGEKRISEEDVTAPDTAYGISKLLAEEVLLSWKKSNPENRLRIIRPGVVFGKGEKGNFTKLFNALRKNLFVYVGRKDTVKGSIYVKDVVKFLLYLTNDSSNRMIYNFVFPKPDTISKICNSICKVMGWKRFIPVIPFRLLLLISYIFELLNNIGLKNPIHHRRIEKLYYSTHLSAVAALASGFKYSYTLESALEDWKKDCNGEGLF